MVEAGGNESISGSKVMWDKYLSTATWVRWYRPYVHFWKYFEWAKRRRNIKLLDVGCGRCTSLLDCSLEYTAYGVEVSPEVVVYADKAVKGNIVLADAHYLPFRNESFDVVTAFDVLEHLPRPELLIKEAYRVLRCGGYFAFTTPSKPGRSKDPTHVSEKYPKEWSEILQKYGFKVKMYYIPAVITIFLLLKYTKMDRRNAINLNVTSGTWKLICYLEEPARKILGLYYGVLKTRLYGLALKTC